MFQVRGDLYCEINSGTFLVTQFLWTQERIAFAVTIFNTLQYVLPAHTASSRQVSAVPGKQFYTCIPEQKALSAI